jgi:hypothetical protein
MLVASAAGAPEKPPAPAPPKKPAAPAPKKPNPAAAAAAAAAARKQQQQAQQPTFVMDKDNVIDPWEGMRYQPVVRVQPHKTESLFNRPKTSALPELSGTQVAVQPGLQAGGKPADATAAAEAELALAEQAVRVAHKLVPGYVGENPNQSESGEEAPVSDRDRQTMLKALRNDPNLRERLLQLQSGGEEQAPSQVFVGRDEAPAEERRSWRTRTGRDRRRDEERPEPPGYSTMDESGVIW